MKILIEYPPNYSEINARFELHKGIIFTYGDILYNPDKGNIDKVLMVHEEVHSTQQREIGVEKWWSLYLNSNDFRISQEIEAYQAQYKEQKKWIKDRNTLDRFLNMIARDLSSEMYGSIMSFSEAREAIKNPIPFKFDLTLIKEYNYMDEKTKTS